jgi:hypothetical protein
MRLLIWVIAVCWLIARADALRLGCVLAQTPVVRFEPASVEIEVGQEAEIQIYIDNVDELYGIDLRFEFTAGLIEVLDVDDASTGIQLQPGSFPYPDYMARNLVDNVEGTGLYTVVQLSPREPARGSGAVATIRLRGAIPGTCLFGMPYVRAVTSDAIDVPVDTEGGEVLVRDSGQVLATLPPTRTATPGPAATNTVGPAPSATSAPGSGYPISEAPTPLPTSNQLGAYPPAVQQPSPTQVGADQPPSSTQGVATQPPGIVLPQLTALPPTAALPPADRPLSPATPPLLPPDALAPEVGAPDSPSLPLPQAPGPGEIGPGPQGQAFLIPTLEPLPTPPPRAERPEPLIARELFTCLVVVLAAFSLLLGLYLIRRPGRPPTGG